MNNHSTTSKRRRSPKGENRRKAILDAGLSVFGRDGYSAASIQSVAQEAGLTLPGLLHHFPTKVHLLLALLEKRDIDNLGMIEAGTSDWKKFLIGLKTVCRANRDAEPMIRAFSILNAESLVEDHPAANWFAARAISVSRLIVDFIRNGQKEGEIDPDIVPEHISAEIIAMMDGIQILWLRDPDQTDMVPVFDGYIDRLVDRLEWKK